MMMPIVILFTTIIVCGIAYLASIGGNYQVKRSYIVNASLDTVFDKLRDFKSWPEWSPWLMHEPETRLDYSENCNEEGGYYSWDGQYIGAGKLTHITLQRPTLLQQQIEFIRPFKSVCDVSFELKEKDVKKEEQWFEKTEVTWIMNGKMPFLLRFMIPQTVNMISKDFDLGLAMLAGELDPYSAHPKLRFDGKITLEPHSCLCKSFSGFVDEMEKTMQAGFIELMEYAAQQKIRLTGKPLTVYRKVNLKKMHFVCDMALPVNENISSKDYEIKRIQGGRYYKVTLQGAYRFLELAWYSAYAHIHMLKIKADKSRPAIEVYENEPNSVSTTNDLITSIYIPIK